MKPLIVGIDPGTTSAAAGVDFEGELEFLFSERHISTSELIEKIIENGRPVIITSDKAKTPSKVNKIASSFGAELYEPESDLRQKEKAELGDGDNYHEIDASAAAFNAYNNSRKQIRKIKEIASEENLDLLEASRIYYQDVSLEEQDEEETEEEENKVYEPGESIETRLRRKINRLESEIDELEKEKEEALDERARIEKTAERLRQKNRDEIESEEIDRKDSIIDRKDREIERLEASVESSMDVIKAYRKGVQMLFEGSELIPVADEVDEIEDKAVFRTEEAKETVELDDVELWDVEEIKGLELKDFIIVEELPEKNFKDVIRDYRESR
jgi:predicted RNase H-like nuclease (RuvC/YqgF family)